MSRPVRRVLSLRAVAPAQVAAIHLRRTLPHASSDLPGSSGEQPSNAPCLVLLQVGFTEPHRSPGALVVSYTTVSPLLRRSEATGRSVLCGTVPRVTPGGCYPPPCSAEPGRSSAGASSTTRPPGRLIRVAQGSRVAAPTGPHRSVGVPTHDQLAVPSAHRRTIVSDAGGTRMPRHALAGRPSSRPSALPDRHHVGHDDDRVAQVVRRELGEQVRHPLPDVVRATPRPARARPGPRATRGTRRATPSST